MAKFYANENFPLPVVQGLRERGHDVLTTLEAGKANQSIEDDEALNLAASLERAVLTLNRRHFVRLPGARLRGRIMPIMRSPGLCGVLQLQRCHFALFCKNRLRIIVIRKGRDQRIRRFEPAAPEL